MTLENLKINISRNTFIILNIIGILYALFLNIISNALPLNNKTAGEISDSLYNFFAPSGYVFAIWFIIYLGWFAILLFTIFEKENSDWFNEKINIWLFLNLLLNGTWLIFWHYDQYLLSVFFMLGIFLSLLILYQRLEIGVRVYSRKETLLIQIPVSIYFGWITVATIANITAYLVSIGITFDSLDSIITIIVLVIGTLITLLLLYRKKDVFFPLVPVWAFLGIFVKQNGGLPIHSVEVAYSALVLALIILVATIYTAYTKYFADRA